MVASSRAGRGHNLFCANGRMRTLVARGRAACGRLRSWGRSGRWNSWGSRHSGDLWSCRSAVLHIGSPPLHTGPGRPSRRRGHASPTSASELLALRVGCCWLCPWAVSRRPGSAWVSRSEAQLVSLGYYRNQFIVHRVHGKQGLFQDDYP